MTYPIKVVKATPNTVPTAVTITETPRASTIIEISRPKNL